MGNLVAIIAGESLEVEVVKKVVEAEKAAANKSAQEAKAIKVCWHNICKLHRGHHYKLNLILIRQFTIRAGGKLDTEFFVKLALRILLSN